MRIQSFIRRNRGLMISVAVFALMLLLAAQTFQGVGTGATVAQDELVQNAVRRAALTCFCVEGRYPPSLDHLRAAYGLHYDEARYTVVYEAFASNVMPDIRVTALGGIS